MGLDAGQYYGCGIICKGHQGYCSLHFDCVHPSISTHGKLYLKAEHTPMDAYIISSRNHRQINFRLQ